MAFLSPLFLLGALAAAVPIVLHLLRQEPDARVRFAAVHMLQHAPVEHADKRRLRDLLLLALRVAALVLLALAFARPFVTSGAASATSGVTVVALDTSFSLSAPGRFAQAQELARTAVREAPAGQLVAVVTFADGGQVVQAATGDRALAVGAIDNTATTFGATRYRAALATAADAIGDREGRIVVVTDLQASGWDVGDRIDLPERVQVEVRDLGALPANLAVTAARLSGDRIIATVRNGGGEAREARVRQVVDDKPAGEVGVTVAGGQVADVALPPARGTTASITVDDPDGIAADNTRYLVLAAGARPLVLVVTNAGDLGRDAFYSEQALKASGADGAAFELAGASGAQLSSWDDQTLGRHAALVLLSTRGLDQRGRELIARYLRRGGGVLVAASQDVDAQVLAGLLGTPLEVTVLPPPKGSEGRALAPADLRHPVFRAFANDAATLGLVNFRQVAAIRAPGCAPLARFSSAEPALLECAVEQGHALLFASDLDGRWNDFPLHATFVPFLHETVAYLGGSRSRTAGYLVSNPPAGVPPQPGIQMLPTPGGPPDARTPIAVNVDGRESDPSRLSVEQFRAVVAPAPVGGVGGDSGGGRDGTARPAGPSRQTEARQQEERQNLWRYAILVVLAVLAAESLVATRAA